MNPPVERKNWFTVFSYYGGTLVVGGLLGYAALLALGYVTDRIAELIIDFFRDKRRDLERELEDARAMANMFGEDRDHWLERVRELERQLQELRQAETDVENAPRVSEEDADKSATPFGAHRVYR